MPIGGACRRAPLQGGGETTPPGTQAPFTKLLCGILGHEASSSAVGVQLWKQFPWGSPFWKKSVHQESQL